MITWDKIKNMSDEEVVETNNTLKRQLIKSLAINAAVTVTVAIAAHLVSKKLDKSEKE